MSKHQVGLGWDMHGTFFSKSTCNKLDIRDITPHFPGYYWCFADAKSWWHENFRSSKFKGNKMMIAKIRMLEVCSRLLSGGSSDFPEMLPNGNCALYFHALATP